VYTLDLLNNSAEGLRIRYPCCWSLARATRIVAQRSRHAHLARTAALQSFSWFCGL